MLVKGLLYRFISITEIVNIKYSTRLKYSLNFLKTFMIDCLLMEWLELDSNHTIRHTQRVVIFCNLIYFK